MKKNLMKKTACAVLAAAMAFSLTACGGSSGDSASSEAAEVSYKDTFTFSQAADIVTLDPADTAAIPTLDVLCGIYDSLVTFDADMNVVPCLATEWDQEDELHYTFKLRDDVVFHNGDPMTAEDVVYSIKRLAVSAKNASLMSALEDAEAVDDYTVKFTLSQPAPTFLNNLANTAAAILPQSYMEENGEDIITTAPVGTGAYKFVEWKQGSSVTMEANEDYWDGEVTTKNVIMKVIPEASQRTIALETGEIDCAYGVQSNDISRIDEDPTMNLLMAPALSTAFVCMNYEKAGIDNKDVREAIRLAIDSQSIVDAVYYGAAEPDNTIIPFAAFGYQEDAAEIEYNPEKAKELLAAAGYGNGFSTNIYTNDNQQSVEICQIIQAQLKEVGIDCEVKTLEFGTFLDKIGSGEHDLCLMTWSTGTVDADFTYYAQFHSSQYGIYGNMMTPDLFPGLDEKLDEARSTSDQEVRMAAYKEVEEILTENSIYRPLVCRSSVVGTTAKVENFELRANDIYNFKHVKVQE
ncbi:MAG: ABC transporter substrate-binding protein [Lachnospiraceae bacterium]|nr:ABC transporter substrate-binding protein [Lachnospiraceae bacterium]